MEFRLLGPVEVYDRGDGVAVGGSRMTAVLAALLLRLNQPVTTGYLVEAAWPEPPPSVAANLRSFVSRLRRTFDRPDGPQLLSQPGGYLLSADPAVLDLHRFEAGIGDGQAAMAHGDAAGGTAHLRAALALWRGAPLQALPPTTVLQAAARRLEDIRLTALEAYAEAQLILGEHETVAGELRELTARHPLRERMWAHLMVALYRCGRQSEALAAYSEIRRHLVAELGITPGPELNHLQEQILRTDPALRSYPRRAQPEPVFGGGEHAPSSSVRAQPEPGFGESEHAASPTVRAQPQPGSGGGGHAPSSSMRARPESGSGEGEHAPSSPALDTDRRPATVAGDGTELPAPAEPVTFTPLAGLPPAVADFTGRTPEVARLRDGLATRPAETGPAVWAIDGTAGVGKTSLAVHVAHLLRPAYPDGQLYLNLRGAQRHPVEPAVAIERLLRALGVPGAAIPAGLDDRVAAYRARLAGRRVLVLLDNAADETQVRPLLPGAGPSSVLLTGRTVLAGLEGARLVSLDVLPRPEALLMLSRAVGGARVAAEPAAAETIVDRCGRLPLAVRVAAARLVGRPHWRLVQLADRLRDERRRLDELSVGDFDVRASFALSYAGLDPLRRLAFRRLTLLEAADFPAWVVAPLLDVPPDRAEDLVEALVDARLVEVAGRDGVQQTRYRLHDLLRAFGRDRTAVEGETAAKGNGDHTAAEENGGSTTIGGKGEPAAVDREGDRTTVEGECGRTTIERQGDRTTIEREGNRTTVERDGGRIDGSGGDRAALLRLFDAWLELAERADEQVPRQGLRVDHGPGRAHRYGDVLGDRLLADPLSWFDAEAGHLRSTVEQMVTLGCREHAWRLAAALAGMWDLRARFDDWDHVHQIALDCVCGDRAATEAAEGELTSAKPRLRLRSPEQAAEGGITSAESRLRLRSPERGEAVLLQQLGMLRCRQNRLEEAMAAFQHAKDLFEEVGDAEGAAYGWYGIGWMYAWRGRPAEARDCHHRALAGFTRSASEAGLVEALCSLGAIERRAGDFEAAQQHLYRSWELAKRGRDEAGEMFVALELGRLRQAQGSVRPAIDFLELSLNRALKWNDRDVAANVRLLLAEAHLKADAPAAARHEIQQALAFFQPQHDRAGEAWAWRLLSRVHCACGEVAPALDYAHRAAAVLTDLDMPQERARALRELGRALWVAHRPAEATRYWQEALTWFDTAGFRVEADELRHEARAATTAA